jgi:hypothetical protein
MTPRFIVVPALACALLACGQKQGEPVPTPLPTKQTTIDQVQKKLDAALAADAENRKKLEEAIK